MGLSAAFKLPAGFGAASAIPQTAPVPVQRAPSAFSPEEERILNLLADGHSQETVAATLGITPSAISQHLSKDFFRNELASRKALRLQKYKELDNGYDDVERPQRPSGYYDAMTSRGKRRRVREIGRAHV